MSLVIRNAEVGGQLVDVHVVGPAISAIGRRLSVGRVGSEIDAGGGVLLPGLHDHHVHLLAMAAALESLDCGSVHGGADGLAAALRASPGAWVRAVGYHEELAGVLDRHRLDAMVPDRPVRVQHVSGALWILNSAALRAVEHALDDTADVERGDDRAPNGRLWRYDDRLRAAMPATEPDLARVGTRLASYGITGVTDATPDIGDDALGLLGRARADGSLPQEVMVLGTQPAAALPAGVTAGPRKIMLRDHDLPTFDELIDIVRTARSGHRAVAVHCVSADSLALTVAALAHLGPVPGDRIEHASVVPPALVGKLVQLGVAIVTQPDFLRTRGERYLEDVEPAELEWLYPYRSLEAAGLRVVPSSDAPFGDVDPWAVLRSARERATAQGAVLNPSERVGVSQALRGYLTRADEPGGRARDVSVGSSAELCLLRRPLAEVLSEPSAVDVRATVVAGSVVHETE